MVKVQQAEHIKNFYLDRARIEGCLTTEDRAELTTKMKNIGLEVTSITAPITPVVRNLNDYPVIDLLIETEFEKDPFMIGLFLQQENELKPKFGGRVFSEYAGP